MPRKRTPAHSRFRGWVMQRGELMDRLPSPNDANCVALGEALDGAMGHTLVSGNLPNHYRAHVLVRLQERGWDVTEQEFAPDGDPIRTDPHSRDWYDGYGAAMREVESLPRFERATAKGTAVDVDEWDRPLFVLRLPTNND